jgi:hypothetical protein
VAAAEDFAQDKLHFVDDIQHDYEVIRPIVLLAETMAERSRQTGLERTVVGAKARRFAMAGMLGLVDQRLGNLGRKGHGYPEAIAAPLLYIKQIYPPIHDRELVRIVQRKLGYQTNHHTVKHFLVRPASPSNWSETCWPLPSLPTPIRRAGPSSGWGMKGGTNRASRAV